MQTIFYIRTLLAAMVFAVLTSCSNSGSDQQKKQEESDEKGIEGHTDAQVVEIKGVFHTRSSQCLKNFGLCEFRMEPDDQNSNLDTLKKNGQKEYNTTFTMDGNKDLIKIEFMEEIPYYDSIFVVERDTALSNFLHYDNVEILKGDYKTDKSFGQFGGVYLKIKKGNTIKG